MSANGAPAQIQPPPRQILELPPPFTHMEVQRHPEPGMAMLVIIDRTKNELHSYPVPAKYAAELGRELMAPSVEIAQSIPSGNGRG